MAVRKPLVVIAGQTQEIPAGDTIDTGGTSAAISNLISVPTTIAADMSYIVASYLTVTSDLTVNGNLLITG